jgi:hypothetical protein
MNLLKFFNRSKAPEAAPSLAGIELYIREIPGAIEIVQNFPRINWELLHEAAAAYKAHPAINALWTELAAQWLGILRDHLDAGYEIYESDHLLILSRANDTDIKKLAKLGDQAFSFLENLMRRSATERGFGKHAVLIIENRAAYYDYLAPFYPERERSYGTSAGAHIGLGYSHTVICGACRPFERTLVHELAHNLVRHRPLPRWLNEGFAQFAEGFIATNERVPLDRRQVRLHYRYWSWFKTDEFWNGEAFSSATAQRLSYQLAKILFLNLTTNRKRRGALVEFLSTAHHQDGGAAACSKCFGCSLSDLVAEFLGPGDWGPREPAIEGG